MIPARSWSTRLRGGVDSGARPRRASRRPSGVEEAMGQPCQLLFRAQHRGQPQRRRGLARARELAFGVLLALVGALALPSAPAVAQEPLLWGSLEPGPHAVGFRKLYALDDTRQYDPEYSIDPQALPAHRPRPILVCLWYPAAKTGAQPIEYR